MLIRNPRLFITHYRVFISITVLMVIISLQSSDLGWTLKRAVQEELSKSFVNVKDIKRLVPVIIFL